MKYARATFGRRGLLKLAAGTALLAACGTAGGSGGTKSLEELIAYKGADREKMLADGAKKEGSFTIYTSIPVEDITAITDAFKAKYGLTANIWRAGSEEVLDRGLKEAKANRFDVDFFETNGPELETLFREKITQPVDSPLHATLIKGAVPEHKGWVSTRINLFVQAYNTNRVKKDDLPKAWKDLLDPKWKGLITIEQSDWDWFYGVVQHLGGEEPGTQFFKDLVAKNGVSLRKGHTQLSELQVAGDVPFTLTQYSYIVDGAKKKGGPVDWFVIETAIARPNGAALPKRPPHPYSAVLFYDWLLGEDGGKAYKARDIMVTNTKVDETVAKTSMKVLDIGKIVDEQKKWSGLFNQIVAKS